MPGELAVDETSPATAWQYDSWWEGGAVEMCGRPRPPCSVLFANAFERTATGLNVHEAARPGVALPPEAGLRVVDLGSASDSSTAASVTDRPIPRHDSISFLV